MKGQAKRYEKKTPCAEPETMDSDITDSTSALDYARGIWNGLRYLNRRLNSLDDALEPKECGEKEYVSAPCSLMAHLSSIQDEVVRLERTVQSIERKFNGSCQDEADDCCNTKVAGNLD